MSLPFVKAALHAQSDKGLLRSRKCVSASADGVITIDGKTCLNFASNDYLGLSQHPDVLQSFVEGLAVYGAGSTASSVVCGYSEPHRALEDKLKQMFNKEAVVLFNSGFAANQAICHALFSSPMSPSKVDNTIICDKYMHASFIEAAMHTEAELLRFKHNDLSHFKAKYNKRSRNTLVATEGVFSMDGDLAHILSKMQQEMALGAVNPQTSMLMLDDAHGFGVIGRGGLGLSGLVDTDRSRIDILMATFGKAIGTAGAFVACSEEFAHYLINFARHYIYSTAIPPAQAVATLKSIELMKKGALRRKLHDNIRCFQEKCMESGLPAKLTDTAIQPIIIGDSASAIAASARLMELGIYTPAIRTPTVPKGSERLRITLTAQHTAKDVKALVDALNIVREEQKW